MKSALVFLGLCLSACVDTKAAGGISSQNLEVKSWVYQLSNYQDDSVNQLASTDFDLVVIDLGPSPETYFSPDEIGKLKASRKTVLAYFEIGGLEDYRPEWELVAQTANDLLLNNVAGWPGEKYAKYDDERWWNLVVKRRVDQALAAGFDGAYLDLIVGYEEATYNGVAYDFSGEKMVALIQRLSQYAKSKNPNFLIFPQNAPELKDVGGFTDAIDGLGIEELFFLATDTPCAESWCEENLSNVKALSAAGKLILAVDYATQATNIKKACTSASQFGFVEYVATRNLDEIKPKCP